MFSQQITHRKYPNAVIPRLYFHIKLIASMFLRLCSGLPRIEEKNVVAAVGVMSVEASSNSALSGPGVEKTTYSLSHALGPQHYLHYVHLYNLNGN